MAGDGEPARPPDRVTLGEIEVLLGAAAEPGEAMVTLDLRRHQETARTWLGNGALLGLQALHPLVSPHVDPTGLRFLGAGPGAGAAAWVAARVRMASVVLVADAEEEGRVRALMEGVADATPIRFVRSPDQLDGAVLDHVVVVGLGGASVGEVARFGPYALRLRPEGQMSLFGFPDPEVPDTSEAMAVQGFALRAYGRRDGLAFLGGSWEHRRLARH